MPPITRSSCLDVKGIMHPVILEWFIRHTRKCHSFYTQDIDLKLLDFLYSHVYRQYITIAQKTILWKKIFLHASKTNVAIKLIYLYREFHCESFETVLRNVRLIVLWVNGILWFLNLVISNYVKKKFVGVFNCLFIAFKQVFLFKVSFMKCL